MKNEICHWILSNKEVIVTDHSEALSQREMVQIQLVSFRHLLQSPQSSAGLWCEISKLPLTLQNIFPPGRFWLLNAPCLSFSVVIMSCAAQRWPQEEEKIF